MLVRTATVKDTDDIVRLKMLLVASSWSDDPNYLDGYPDYEPRLRARLAELLDDPAHRYWVAEVDGRTVGCMSASIQKHLPGPDWSGIGAHLSDLVVDDEYRGRGIAKALMEAAMAWVREQGALWVELHATRMARGMYEAMGWEVRQPEPDDATFVSMHLHLRED